MATTSETVIKIVAETLSVEERQVVPEALLEKDLGADSLALVQLAMDLEDAFSSDEKKLTIPDDDLYRIKTVQDIHDCLSSHGI